MQSWSLNSWLIKAWKRHLDRTAQDGRLSLSQMPMYVVQRGLGERTNPKSLTHDKYSAQGGKVKWSQMPMYVVPSGPGRSRVLWWMCVDAQGLPRPMKLLAGLKPRWVEHVKTRNLVFEGDNIILHMQARALGLLGIHCAPLALHLHMQARAWGYCIQYAILALQPQGRGRAARLLLNRLSRHAYGPKVIFLNFVIIA